MTPSAIYNPPECRRTTVIININFSCSNGMCAAATAAAHTEATQRQANPRRMSRNRQPTKTVHSLYLTPRSVSLQKGATCSQQRAVELYWSESDVNGSAGSA